MKGRLIAIGDVHGCAREFEELLSKLALERHDRVVLLGDLINRGPDSAGVIALARKHAHLSLLGNHELRLLNYRKTNDPTHLKKSDYDTLKQLSRSDWAYLSAMPLTYCDRRDNIVLVHGGFLPHVAWHSQPARVVTRIQNIDKDGNPRKRSDAPNSPHWSTLWKGPPFVVYGHTSRPHVARLKWSLGIDSGCAMGGRLTACILPEQKLVQVRAHETYYSS
jgi:diadenosine tetraphosphatase ApaH/serine/threonine PP2A family protein phosphatase